MVAVLSSERWGDRPIEMDCTPVKVRDYALHPIWWRGRQWAVTSFGIERLDGSYVIAAARLTGPIGVWPWPSHMAEKEWIDMPDFMTAWLVALTLHDVSAKGARKAIMDTVIYPKPGNA
jgi:hypothetical protein